MIRDIDDETALGVGKGTQKLLRTSSIKEVSLLSCEIDAELGRIDPVNDPLFKLDTKRDVGAEPLQVSG